MSSIYIMAQQHKLIVKHIECMPILKSQLKINMPGVRHVLDQHCIQLVLYNTSTINVNKSFIYIIITHYFYFIEILAGLIFTLTRVINV